MNPYLVVENPDRSLGLLTSLRVHYLRSIQRDDSYEFAIRSAYEQVLSYHGNRDAYQQALENNDPCSAATTNKLDLSLYPYLAASVVKRALRAPTEGNANGDPNFSFLYARLQQASSQGSSPFTAPELRTRNILSYQKFSAGPSIQPWTNSESFLQLLSTDFINYGPLVIDLRGAFNRNAHSYTNLPNRTSYSIDGGFGIVLKLPTREQEISVFLPSGRSIAGQTNSRLRNYSIDSLAHSLSINRWLSNKPYWFKYTGDLPI